MSTSGPRWLTAQEQVIWRNFVAAWGGLLAAVDVLFLLPLRLPTASP